MVECMSGIVGYHEENLVAIVYVTKMLLAVEVEFCAK